MKKLFILGFVLISSYSLKAQNGLEGIIVEKYYVSDANDTVANSTGEGILPIGSVTYRVFADMLPGYKLQAIYGTPAPNLHELKFATTTLFFNNENRGSTFPTYTKTQAKGASVMLDSWVSVGAACAGQYGILKSEDDGVANVVNNNAPLMLQNANPLAGIPLTVQDGLVAGTPAPQAVTLVGITAVDLALIDNTNDPLNGNTFVSSNGSIAALAGAAGPDPATNKVIIGQFTTDGVFTFELNLQIGTPTGGTQQYVSTNATGSEILLSSLSYSSANQLSKFDLANPTFNLYPNPADDKMSLVLYASTTTSNNNYKIYDVVGHLIYEKKLGKITVNQAETIDVSILAKGQYILELNINGIRSTKKIIKK
jgi:Secretion system C-terminal sorting domain